MTFPSNITLREQPLSAELYEFSFSNGNTLHYTSYERDVLPADFDGVNTWTHIPIERSEYTIDDQLSSDRMKITAPVLNLWANMGIQSGQISVKIIKVFLVDKSYQVIFNGLVLNIKKNVGQGEAECASKMYYLEKELPRVFFQSACNNTLFDDFCTMLKADYQYTFTVTVGQNGYLLTIDNTEYLAFLADFLANHGFSPPQTGVGTKALFTLGQASYGGEVRYITKHAVRGIYLHYPFNGLTANGSIVSMIFLPGCDKNGAYCRGVFGDHAIVGNMLNFTGMPYIPASDPTVRAVGA